MNRMVLVLYRANCYCSGRRFLGHRHKFVPSGSLLAWGWVGWERQKLVIENAGLQNEISRDTRIWASVIYSRPFRPILSTLAVARP